MNLNEKLLTLTPEKRKLAALLIVAAVVIAVLCMPSLSDLRRLYSSAIPARPVKPSPFAGAHPSRPPVLPPRAVAPQGPILSTHTLASPGLPTPGNRLGLFEGKTFLPKMGVICAASVELYRVDGQEAQIVAYQSLQCTDPMAMYSAPKNRSAVRDTVMGIAGKMLPVSHILSGTWQGGVLRLHVEKTTGQQDDCAMTSASMTPFGYRQVLFEWEGGTCGKGEMMLAQIGM